MDVHGVGSGRTDTTRDPSLFRTPGGHGTLISGPAIEYGLDFIGEPGGTRTHGPKIKSLVLYQLSYGLTRAGLNDRSGVGSSA